MSQIKKTQHMKLVIFVLSKKAGANEITKCIKDNIYVSKLCLYVCVCVCVRTVGKVAIGSSKLMRAP